MEEPEQLFNSSDIEFSPVTQRYANAGSTSVASMREKLFEDRISSKKRVHGLTDTRGAPGTQYARSLWLNRIENYMKDNKMVIDPQTGPDHITIIRFVDTVVNHINGRAVEAPTPLRKSIKKGILSLFSALTFEYPKFNLSKHECSRIDALIDGLSAEGKLLRGRRREKFEWIGVSIVEKMSRCWLQAALDNGCLSWDIIIHKALTVVLQCALACRGGEIAKSKGYTAEYMRWSHLMMKLPPGENTLDDVQLTCLLKFEKTKKLETNEDRDIPLRTLRDPSLNVVCPVKLLLIQALRSGNISSLDDALTQASLRPDRTIQWLYPERPVIPQLIKCSAFLAWDIAGGTGQVNNITKDLALVGGILTSLVSHDVRRGAFRDLANAKPSSNSLPVGVATKEVAQVTGHSAASYLKGTTDHYVGEVEKDTYTARAEHMFVGRKAPTIGNPYKKRRLTKSEIDTYCEESSIDPVSKNGRQKAGEAIHRQRKVDWMESEKGGQEWTPSIPSRISVSKTRTTASRSSTTTPASALIATPTPTTSSVASTASASPIDPRLLLLDGGDVVIQDAAAAERLDSLILNNAEDLGEDEQAMGLDTFLENSDQSSKTSILALPGREFVKALSKINIVRNYTLVRQINSLHELFPTHCPMGNSREYPTLFIYSCEMCNDYSTRSKDNLQVHQLVCKGEDAKDSKKEKLFICEYGGCGSAFTAFKTLQAHFDGVHLWEPRKCDIPGCARDRVFKTRSDLSNHIMQRHHPIEPAIRCSYPGCTSKILWYQMHNYKEHLKLRHHLVSSAMQKPYLPRNASSQKVSTAYFQSTSCPIGGSPACTNIYKRLGDLTRHLTRGIHGMSLEEARKINRSRETDQEVQSFVGGDGHSEEGV